MRRIESESNPRFRQWLKLATQPRAVREQGRTLAEGLHLAQAALAAALPIDAVLVRAGARASGIAEIVEALRARGADAVELPARLFDRVSPVESSAGLMTVIRVPAQPVTESLAADCVYLDGIQDPGNAGALLRVAAAAGVVDIFAAPGTTALWAPRALRAGQGAHFMLRIAEGVTVDAAAATLRGTWIAADPHHAESLWAAALPAGPIGWVFGAEGAGISPAMRARCALRVRIALAPGVESLNVAAAAAVLLFERRRRVATAPKPAPKSAPKPAP